MSQGETRGDASSTGAFGRKTYANPLVELRTFVLDALRHAGRQLRESRNVIKGSKGVWSGVAHLELFDDRLADPFHLGVEGKHIHRTLRGRVCEGVSLGTKLFTVLESLLGLEYK